MGSSCRTCRQCKSDRLGVLIPILLVCMLVLCTACELPRSDILAVKERHESQLLSIPNVVGVGVGACNGEPCIKVFVAERTAELERQIPRELEGYRVDIEIT